MARRAQVDEVAPKTLPDDFNFWDGGEPPPPSTLPKDFDDFDEAPPTQAKPSGPRAAAAAPGKVAEMPANRMSVPPPAPTTPAPIAPPAPKRKQEVPIKREPAVVPKRSGSISLNLREDSAAAPAAREQSSKYVTTEELSSLVQEYNATLDDESDVEAKRKKTLMIRWIGAIVLVLAIVAGVFALMLHKPAAKSQSVVVVQNPVVTYTPDATPTKEKPSPAKPAQP